MSAFTIAHTKAERERIALNLLQEYMRTEAMAKTPTDEMAGSLLRLLVRIRKKEAAEREEEQSMLDVYMAALGMLPDEANAYTDLATESVG